MISLDKAYRGVDDHLGLAHDHLRGSLIFMFILAELHLGQFTKKQKSNKQLNFHTNQFSY